MHAGPVMALDLSSTTGWCVGCAGALSPDFGCWLLPKAGGEGARYVAFENELIAAIKETRGQANGKAVMAELQRLRAEAPAG